MVGFPYMPDVVRLAPVSSGFMTLNLRHRGSSNFFVCAYTADNTELLVNETGTFRFARPPVRLVG
jgi:hypothetical protein